MIKQKILKWIIGVLVVILIIMNGIAFFDENLRIFFVDVGQGDCTMIKTPKGKCILIDAGEGHNEKYDMGKNVVLPYLLDRGIKRIDYVIVSHFDSDHVGGLLSIMEEIQASNVIIPRQVEDSKNFEELLKITSDRNMKIINVEKGEVVELEENLLIGVLWPDGNKIIEENALNNNSLVFKLVYNDFSMLFTGDIEELAENAIVEEYGDGALDANVLKVAHHGSKTSSTEKFIDLVHPQIALIGVGKNNKFGHPSEEVIERIKQKNINIYRTDNDGEIMIEVGKDGKIKRSLSKVR